jgi:toxin ParE1/3/4
MTYRLTRQAQSDIKAIYHYTVEYFGERQAREYLDGLDYSFDLLTDNPKLGRLWDGKGRRYVYKSHLVYYRIVKDEIVLTRIRNARQQP